MVVREQNETPSRLVALALEKGADPDTLSKLLDLQERYEAGEARKAYVTAMTSFKVEAPAVLKKGDRVDFTTSRGRTAYNYANLGSIVQEITAIMGKHDLSASWSTAQAGRDVTVTCHITHVAGHRESVTLTGPIDESGNKNSIQAVGSTVTYLQRYTLLAALGLATGEDDDGRGGVGPGRPPAGGEKKGGEQAAPTPTGDRPPDNKQMQVAVSHMLTEQYGDKAMDELERLTTWTKDGVTHAGKRNAFELAVKEGVKGATQTSVIYHKVKAEYEKWKAAMEETTEGEVIDADAT
jgi:hypothetical protein